MTLPGEIDRQFIRFEDDPDTDKLALLPEFDSEGGFLIIAYSLKF